MELNSRQKIAIVVLNVLIFAEIFLSMYLASKEEDLTLAFLKYFLIMVIPTFIIGRKVIRRLRSEVPLHGTPDLVTMQKKFEKDRVKERSTVARTAILYPEKLKMLTRGDVKLAQASQWRRLAGKAAAVFLILLFISFLDSCIARISEPINVFNVIRGTSVKVNGSLSEKVNSVQELTYVSSSHLIRLSIEEIYSGFWLGGAEWRGVLTVSPHIEPGEYELKVVPKVQVSQKPPIVFLVKVYQDELSLSQSSKSFIKRHSGISPWWVFAFFFTLTVLTFGTVFFLSSKIEHLMAKGGHAEVYWVKAGVAGTEIAFGLGTRHGVQPGARLSIFDESGQPVGTVVVQESTEKNSLGIVESEYNVRPGCIVSIKKW